MIEYLTEREHILLSALSYINFNRINSDNIFLKDIVEPLLADQSDALIKGNSMQRIYDLGAGSKPAKGKGEEWGLGGNLPLAETNEILQAILDNPKLADLKLVHADDYGPGTRNLTFINQKANEIIIACRGTGAQEWITNTEAIIREYSSWQVHNQCYLREQVTNLFEHNTISDIYGKDMAAETFSIAFTGHSNGGNKAEVMALTCKLEGPIYDEAMLSGLDHMGTSYAADKLNQQHHEFKEVFDKHIKEIRVYPFDGFHMSEKFFSRFPQAEKWIGELSSKGMFVNIHSRSDYVHGLGKQIRDCAIDIRGRFRWPPLASQHFIVRKMDFKANGRESHYQGIKGYRDGSFKSPSTPGLLSKVVAKLSTRIVRMEDKWLQHKIIMAPMNLMTAVKSTIPAANRVTVLQLLAALAVKGVSQIMQLPGKLFTKDKQLAAMETAASQTKTDSSGISDKPELLSKGTEKEKSADKQKGDRPGQAGKEEWNNRIRQAREQTGTNTKTVSETHTKSNTEKSR